MGLEESKGTTSIKSVSFNMVSYSNRELCFSTHWMWKKQFSILVNTLILFLAKWEELIDATFYTNQLQN